MAHLHRGRGSCGTRSRPEGGTPNAVSVGKAVCGGFMGFLHSWAAWIAEKVDEWVYGVQILVVIAKYFLQTAYTSLASRVQGKWQYL